MHNKSSLSHFNSEGYLADIFLDDFYGADSELYAGTAFLRLWELLHELGLVTSPHKDCPPRFSTWHSVVYFASAGFPYTTLSHELQKGAFSSLLHKTPTSITFSQIVFYYRLHQTRSHFYVSTFSFNVTQLTISSDMSYDIQWLLDFLPRFNGISIINPTKWDFDAGSNETAVSAINFGKSLYPFMQQCLQQLWLVAATNDFEIQAHVAGSHNTLSDCPGRWHTSSWFRKQFEVLSSQLGRS